MTQSTRAVNWKPVGSLAIACAAVAMTATACDFRSDPSPSTAGSKAINAGGGSGGKAGKASAGGSDADSRWGGGSGKIASAVRNSTASEAGAAAPSAGRPELGPAAGGAGSAGAVAAAGGGAGSGGGGAGGGGGGASTSSAAAGSSGAAAAGGNGAVAGGSPSGSAANGGGPASRPRPRLPGRMDGQRLAARPANASSTGTATVVTAATIDITFSVEQIGDPGDPTFSWSQNIDADDAPEACVEVDDDETSYTFVTCSGFDTQCEDGRRLASTLFLETAPDGALTIAVAGGDVCGSGGQLFGCQYSQDGTEESCGMCAQALGLPGFVCSPQVDFECVDDLHCALLDHCNLGRCVLVVVDE